MIGHQPCTPSAIATGYTGSAPTAYKIAKSWEEQQDLVRACLHKAAKKAKKWADQTRREAYFSEGDMVMVKLHLVLKNKGVVQRIGQVAYKLNMLPKLKVHSMFLVSMLKSNHTDESDLSRRVSRRAPLGVRAAYDQEIEEVLADRVLK